MSEEAEAHTRLNELETKLAFQEQTIDTLNSVITRLQTTVDRLGQEIVALKTQLRTVAPSLLTERGDEKPPHY